MCFAEKNIYTANYTRLKAKYNIVNDCFLYNSFCMSNLNLIFKIAVVLVTEYLCLLFYQAGKIFINSTQLMATLVE